MDGKRITASILGTTALVFGAADASKLDEKPIERIERVAEYRVEAKQIENRVETTFPWKDQQGLKVVYDMGEPTLAERVKDKRKKEVVTEVVDFGDGGFKVDVLLDERPDTNRFCYTIEGAENYDFFYQPPLTEEEIAGGSSRPPEIEGSYAVYHKTLKNHQIGKENYATGKVMHIPRPQVWEVDNKEKTIQWADLSYENGQLCVTASQDFLDNAIYPVRIDPTFGYTSVGAASSLWGANTLFVTGTSSLPVAGSVKNLIWYGANNGSTINAKGIIYSDSSRYPATLVGSSTPIAIVSSNPYWVSMPFSPALSLSAGDYWMGQIADGNFPVIKYDTTAGYGVHDAAGTYATPEATYPAADGESTSYRMSVYATYCVDGTPCTETFNSTGTIPWTAPDGVTEVVAACWGAGGGGGIVTNSGGAGGGGGAFASTTATVTPGVTYNVRIGSGGFQDNDAWAEASSFSTSTCPNCVIASGGQGASPSIVTTEGAGGPTASSTGTTKFAGGAGGNGNGTNDVGGGGGGSAGPHGNGGTGQNTVAASTTGGAGGAADNGSGGAGGAASSGAGNVGRSSLNGGGGGGGANDSAGGAGGYPGGGGGGGETGGGRGGHGQCTLTYTVSLEDSPPFSENFEDADPLPGEFDSEASYATGDFVLDSTSKVHGTYSARCDIPANDDGCILTETITATTSVYAQFSLLLDSGFTMGASGYLGLFEFNDGVGRPIYCNLEDYGTVRLICDGDEAPYMDTGIDITPNVATRLEFRVTASTTGGVLQIWKDNGVEGAPDYSTTTINTGTDEITEMSIGGYHPDAVGDKWYDDICIQGVFMGDNCYSLTAGGDSGAHDNGIIWFMSAVPFIKRRRLVNSIT